MFSEQQTQNYGRGYTNIETLLIYTIMFELPLTQFEGSKTNMPLLFFHKGYCIILCTIQ